MSDSLHDILGLMVGAVAFAAAVTLLMVMLSSFDKANEGTAKEVKTKQSIVQEKENINNLARDVKIPEPTYTAEQVYDAILANQDSSITIRVNGYTIDMNKVKAIKEGDIRVADDVKSHITASTYKRSHVYVAGSNNDRISEIIYKSV